MNLYNSWKKTRANKHPCPTLLLAGISFMTYPWLQHLTFSVAFSCILMSSKNSLFIVYSLTYTEVQISILCQKLTESQLQLHKRFGTRSRLEDWFLCINHLGVHWADRFELDFIMHEYRRCNIFPGFIFKWHSSNEKRHSVYLGFAEKGNLNICFLIAINTVSIVL